MSKLKYSVNVPLVGSLAVSINYDMDSKHLMLNSAIEREQAYSVQAKPLRILLERVTLEQGFGMQLSNM